MAEDHRSAHKPGPMQMRVAPDAAPRRVAPTAAETVPPLPDTEPEAMQTGTVARGRCLELPDPSQPLRERHSCGEGGIINTATFQPCRRFMPGEEVTLPGSEIERLRALGYLIDPDRVIAVVLKPLQEAPPVGPEPRSPAKVS
jgi:hypothetical protein